MYLFIDMTDGGSYQSRRLPNVIELAACQEGRMKIIRVLGDGIFTTVDGKNSTIENLRFEPITLHWMEATSG